jgi:phage RecT family recombinase
MTDDTQIIQPAKGPQAVEVRKLPPPTNSGAELVGQQIDRLIGGVPNYVPRDEMAYALMVAANESELAKCSAPSVLIAAHNCARIGLMPGRIYGYAFFVPLEKRRGSGDFRAELWIGYPGYIELSSRNGYLASVECDCVFEGEEFRVWTDEKGKHMIHEPDLGRDVYRDRITQAYCVAQLRSGGSTIEVCTRSQIDNAKRSTPGWKQNEYEMARKTPIRRAAKRWPKTREMALALTVDDNLEMGGDSVAIQVPPRLHKQQTFATLGVSETDLDTLTERTEKDG